MEPWPFADTGAEGLFLSPAIARVWGDRAEEPVRLGACGEQQVKRQRFAAVGARLARPLDASSLPIRFLRGTSNGGDRWPGAAAHAPPALAAIRAHHVSLWWIKSFTSLLGGRLALVLALSGPVQGPALARWSNLPPASAPPSAPLPLSNDGPQRTGPFKPERPLPLGLRPSPASTNPRRLDRQIDPAQWARAARAPGTPARTDLDRTSNRCQRRRRRWLAKGAYGLGWKEQNPTS